MQPLYQLAAEYRALADRLHDTDLDEQTILDTLEAESGDIETKIINSAKVARNLRAAAKARREAAKPMTDTADREEAQADWIEGYIKRCIEQAGISKISSPWFSVSIRANPPSLIVDDESAIPADYFREIPAKREVNKPLIKAAIKDGVDIPGVHVESTGTRLEIK